MVAGDADPSTLPPQAKNDDSDEEDEDDVVMADASDPGPSRRRITTTEPREARPVGGLLGASEYGKKPTTKLKFVPNMKRKTKVVKDEDDDE